MPQMLIATGATLRHAQALADSMSPNPDRISSGLKDHPEIMAEAASFALAKHGVPRAEAKDIVAKAAAQADFKSTLKELAPNGIDWDAVLDPVTVIPACKEMTAEIFARRSRSLSASL